MAIVKDNPNGDKGTSEGMAVYKFSGMPIEQFESIPETGDVRVITVRVECVATGTEQIKDGDRRFVKWKIVNAAIGRELPEEKPEDPTLPYDGEDDDPDAAATNYGDYDGIGAESDTPTAAMESDAEVDTPSNVRTIQPSFSGAN